MGNPGQWCDPKVLEDKYFPVSLVLDPAFRAKISNFAMEAVGFSGGTAAATVPDQQVGKQGPLFFGNNFHQGLLDFHGVVLAGETHPAGETAHMGVDHNPLGQVKSVAEDHIGGFASHAGKLMEMFHRPRNFAPVIFDQGGGTAADRSGLGTKKTRGADQILKICSGNFGKVTGGVAAGEKSRGDLVDPLIGALRGKNGGDQELKGVGVLQLAMGIGVCLLEFGNDLISPHDNGR